MSSAMVECLKAVQTDVKQLDPTMALQASQAGFGISASQHLGLDFQQNQYNKRLQALTKPEAYARERKDAFDKM